MTVSVIIPCKDQAMYLPDAIRSVQAQSLPDWECIVINDGSTDATEQVAESFATGDRRISVVHQDNRGLSAARNAGISRIRGRYVQFLDADDLLEPTKLEVQVAQLLVTDRLALSYSDYRYCPHDDVMATASRDDFPPPRFITSRPLWDLASRWETEFSIPVHSFLFDARFFTHEGIRFDEALPSHEDWDCWMQILALDPTVLQVPGALAIYRLHGSAMTRDAASMARGFDLALQKQLVRLGDDPELRGRLTRKRSQMRHVYNASTATRATRAVWDVTRRLVPARLRAIWRRRRNSEASFQRPPR